VGVVGVTIDQLRVIDLSLRPEPLTLENDAMSGSLKELIR
jgi:hypothetical protein